eukprot:1170894-Rhodomonas_salina.3
MTETSVLDSAQQMHTAAPGMSRGRCIGRSTCACGSLQFRARVPGSHTHIISIIIIKTSVWAEKFPGAYPDVTFSQSPALPFRRSHPQHTHKHAPCQSPLSRPASTAESPGSGTYAPSVPDSS